MIHLNLNTGLLTLGHLHKDGCSFNLFHKWNSLLDKFEIDKNVRITLLSGVIVGLEAPAWVPSHQEVDLRVLLLNIGVSENTAGKPHAPPPSLTPPEGLALEKRWESVRVIDTKRRDMENARSS